MPEYLGCSLPIEGIIDTRNRYTPGAYTVTMGPQQMGVTGGIGAFECHHIAIQGPPGSNFQVYVGDNFYDYVPRGDINSWDPNQPMQLSPQSVVYFYWNVNTGTPKPTVTMYFQRVTP